MTVQDYDADADAVYVKLTSRKVARTVEVDSGTLADLDDAGRLVGVEVIHPERVWPLDVIMSRFEVSDEQERELRREYARFHPKSRGVREAGAVGVIVVGIGIALRVLRRIITPAR